jgi:hypothetical protein
MSPILEPSYSALAVAKQSVKGTPTTAPTKRLLQVGGDFGFSRDDGSEPYSDLTKYGGDTDWINSLTGEGEPALECTPTELAYCLWLHHGAEVVTAVVGPPTAQKHTFTPSATRGFWATAWRRVGQNVPQRHRMTDCMSTRFTIEGGTANKAVRLTQRWLALDPFENLAADPTWPAMPTDKTFLYTDGSGAFTIDSVVFTGQTQFTFTVDEDLSLVYGDDTVPFELVQGNPTAAISATILMDATALARWNFLVYGTTTPAGGAKPLRSLPALGSYSAYMKQRDAAGALNGRELKITCPAVKWTIPPAPAPNPGGGPVEIALAGALRPPGGVTPVYTIDVNTANADVAFTT